MLTEAKNGMAIDGTKSQGRGWKLGLGDIDERLQNVALIAVGSRDLAYS